MKRSFPFCWQPQWCWPSPLAATIPAITAAMTRPSPIRWRFSARPGAACPRRINFRPPAAITAAPVDDKPGKFDISDTDNLDYMLSFPAGSVDLIDSAASLTHMMNMNTFTCGAYHVKNAADAKTLAQSLRDSIQSRQWMCGFPDKLVVITINEVVVAMYGDEELINSFRDTLTASYPAAVIDFDEAIQ